MSESAEIVADISSDPQSVEHQDDELNNLLNDALNDFGKSNEKDLLSTGVQSNEIPIDPALLENLWNEPGMKEAMSRFETSIRSVFNSTNASNENGTVSPPEGSLTNDFEVGAESGKNETSEIIDVDSIIDDFRKMTKLTAETFTKESGVEPSINADASNSFYEELSKNIMNVARKLSGTIISSEPPTNEDEDDNSFHSMVTQTIKSLTDNNKELESYLNLKSCSEDLEKMLKGIDHKDKINDNFLKFVKICMRTIKLVIYPSLKDLCEKYPSYIETKGSTLTEGEMKCYRKQYEIIEKICQLFEREETDDSGKLNIDDEMDSSKPNSLYNRFINVMNVMKEIQECGQIPKELRDQSKFFDPSDVPDDNVTSKSCSIS